MRHLEPDQIGRGYDELADLWRHDRYSAEYGMAALERAISFLDAGGAALDVGCGASGRFVQRMLDQPLQVEGVDVSSKMLELARQRHPDVTFHQADVCSWLLPTRYCLITAWDSIWHVPLDAHAALLTKLMDGLEEGGVLLFTMGGLDAPEEKTDANMGPTMYYSTLGIPLAMHTIAEAGGVLRHLEFDQHPEPHLVVIAQKRAG